jgi:stage V sporulation protein G
MTERTHMEITEVKVFPINEEKLRAFVSIVFDQCFMVNDIKIIQGRDGLFISMPSRKKKNGEFKDVAHPLNNETRRMIETQVLAEYERVLGERGERTPELSAAVQLRTEIGLGAGADSGDPLSAMPPMSSISPRSPSPSSPMSMSPISPISPISSSTERTMEEVEEMHLRDSFWTVT